MTRFPQMCDVIQTFDTPRVADLVGTVRQQMQSLRLESTVRPGQTVAITAGSRGIANIGLILREIAAYCRRDVEATAGLYRKLEKTLLPALENR